MRFGKELRFAKKICFSFLAISVFAILNSNSNLVYAQNDANSKVVNIYDNGKAIVIGTDKKTVKDALEKAKIKLETGDKVEPSLESEILDSNFNINIYRSQPAILRDGIRILKIMTSSKDGKQIAKDAGLELYDEDVVEPKISFNRISDGAGVEYVVMRATSFDFIFYGKPITARTLKTTIGEYLKEKNVKLEPQDKINLDLNTKITQGMKLEIWREGKQEITVDEDVAFKTREIKDYNRPRGFKEVQTKGENGKRTVSYEIEIKNGKEVSRKEIKSITTKEAKEEVVVVGMKIQLPAGSHEDWLRAAGISEDDLGYANSVIGRESGWNPFAKNPYSGAYGIPQALPGNKMSSAGSDWETNPITQLRWADSYVKGRYYDGSPYAAGLCSGSSRGWECAYRFWQVKHWY